jgi:hypothetical protein
MGSPAGGGSNFVKATPAETRKDPAPGKPAWPQQVILARSISKVVRGTFWLQQIGVHLSAVY